MNYLNMEYGIIISDQWRETIIFVIYFLYMYIICSLHTVQTTYIYDNYHYNGLIWIKCYFLIESRWMSRWSLQIENEFFCVRSNSKIITWVCISTYSFKILKKNTRNKLILFFGTYCYHISNAQYMVHIPLNISL